MAAVDRKLGSANTFLTHVGAGNYAGVNPMLQRCDGRRRTSATTCALVAALLGSLWPSIARAAQDSAVAADPALYRVFLKDGGTLISYGEFAQVGDRVVVSIPIGGTDAAPALELLTIAERDVDWERTNAYAQAVRAHRYAERNGEADYAKLSRDVADTLNQIAFVTEPAKRLALAEAARKQLIEWPQQHYDYRAADLAQMTVWLDQIVSDFRVAAGQSSFDLALVARTPSFAGAPRLLAAPTARERAEMALAAAGRSTDPIERTNILRAIVVVAQPADDAGWMSEVHARASAALAVELEAERAYAGLTSRTLVKADAFAARADVRGLEALIRSVLQEDARLKRSRPADIAALMATLDARLDAARRLRLARDAWVLRWPLLEQYWRDVRQALDLLLGLRAWLVDVRQLAGPSPGAVGRLADLARRAEQDFAAVQPPAETASAHARLRTASTLAARAAATRLEAVKSGSMDTAWQASSAAAGALMLLDESVAELRKITREAKRESQQGRMQQTEDRTQKTEGRTTKTEGIR
jgi:hypothetical protein